MSEILYNIYIWVLIVNSESDLNLAFVHVICCIAILLKTVFFLYFLEAKNPCFVTKNCSKFSYICVIYFVQKTVQLILQKPS